MVERRSLSQSILDIVSSAPEAKGTLDDLVERTRDDPGLPFEKHILDALSDLSDADLERRFADLSKLGRKFPVSRLRAAIANHRQATSPANDLKQGRRLKLDAPEPWPEPITCGARLLDQVSDLIAQHVVMPPGGADAVALWCAHAYVFDHFRHTPRLAITSPEKRCGKTTLLDMIGLLVPKPLPAANISTAAFYRTIEIAQPTITIDEADRFLSRNEELVGVQNAGHKRGGSVIRTVGDDHDPAQFNVFCPLAIAAIGKLPDTLEDRSIEVRMQRALAGERPEPITEATERLAEELRRKLARWLGGARERLKTDPQLPSHLFNRSADNWRPLFALAELAGDDWPDRVRAAERALAGNDEDEDRTSILLLTSLKQIFERDTNPRVFFRSAYLLEELLGMEDMPWSMMPGTNRELTIRQMWRMLKSFGVRPCQHNREGSNVKGLYARDFTNAFARYIPPPASQNAATSSTERGSSERGADSARDHSGSIAHLHRNEKPESGHEVNELAEIAEIAAFPGSVQNGVIIRNGTGEHLTPAEREYRNGKRAMNDVRQRVIARRNSMPGAAE